MQRAKIKALIKTIVALTIVLLVVHSTFVLAQIASRKVLSSFPWEAFLASTQIVHKAGDSLKSQERLRGAMISPQVTATDLETLGRQWKANHVRWQLLWDGYPFSSADRGDLKAYDAWLTKALTHLDQLLATCEQSGLKVLIDLHTPPGGRSRDLNFRLFQEQKFQDAFLQVWNLIAHRYRGNKTIWGYDLLNEPAEGMVRMGLMNWHELAKHAAKNIRAIDQQHAIVVEPIWATPTALKDLKPLPIPGVVYSVHMYEPLHFTHQGFGGRPSGVFYPGKIDNQFWDKQQLQRVLQSVVDYQRQYGVRIYVGEFSAIRWAPKDSAYNYLHDLIEIFEQNGWDWAYHAFREWNGWSVEHTSNQQDQKPSMTMTNRERLLKTWYAKNSQH